MIPCDGVSYGMAQNCWEFKACGREPGGAKVAELGVCPVPGSNAVDGVNHGTNGGRCCWAVAGTLCGGQVQGTFAFKMSNCLQCDFFRTVNQEEGLEKAKLADILAALKGQ